MAYDTGRKARIYAGLGLREYWVVNANTLATTIHLQPGPDGYADVAEHTRDKRIVPHLVRELALAFADLGLKPLR